MQYINDTLYMGEWLNSKRSGKGVLRFSDGSEYSGHWLFDRPHGHGVLSTGL